jgi:hypothetical protein
MRRLLLCLLIAIGSWIAGCEESRHRSAHDGRLSDGQPYVEVTVHQ